MMLYCKINLQLTPIKGKNKKFPFVNNLKQQMIMPTNYRDKEENQRKILEEKNKVDVKKKTKKFILRGGGCGSSVQDKITNQFSEKINLPSDFLEILINNCDILIKKANMLVSGSNSLTSVMLAIQWFHYNAEYIDVCAQRGDYVRQVFELFLNQAEGILKVVPNYIRSQGFIAYRILQIINELLRVVFSFQQKNDQSEIEEYKKESFLELIENIKSEIELQVTEIWKTGVDYELTLIEIMLHNCNINHSIGKGKLADLLKNLVKSACSLEIKEELFDNIFDSGEYLLNLAYEGVAYPKEQYLSYYYFQTLKWKIVQAIKQDQSIQSQMEKIMTKFGTSVKNSDNWVNHFCWVQVICDLLSYRVVVEKKSIIQDHSQMIIQKKWNYLIQINLIKPLPYQKSLGIIQFYTNYQFINFDLKSTFENKIAKFQLFCDSLMSEKFHTETSIWSFYKNFTFTAKKNQQKGDDKEELIMSKIDSQILVILKEQLIKIFQEKQKLINVIQKIFSRFSTPPSDHYLKLQQDELESVELQLWNCMIKQVYLIAEIQEKSTLVFGQIQAIYKQCEQNGFQDEDNIFQFIIRNQKTLKNHLINLVSKVQSAQIQCLNIKIYSYELLVASNQEPKGVVFQKDEDDFDQIIQTISIFISKGQLLIQSMYSFESKKLKSKYFSITLQNVKDTLEQLISQPIAKLYSEQLLNDLSIEDDSLGLEIYLLEAKKKISFLEILINLNRISLGKLIRVLNFGIAINQIQDQNETLKQKEKNQKLNLTIMLENFKNLLQTKADIQLSENFMLSKVEELQKILNLNMKKFAFQKQQQQQEDYIRKAIEQVNDLQNLILEFYMAQSNEKSQAFQKIADTVNSQFTEMLQHNEEEKQAEQIIQKQDKVESILQNFLNCEKVLKDSILKTEKIFIHFQTEDAVRKAQQQNCQLTKGKQYSFLLNEITKDIKNEIINIEKIYHNIFQEIYIGNFDVQIIFFNLNDILNGFSPELDKQHFHFDQQYLDVTKIINQMQQDGLAVQSGNDYKVREALVMNLMKVQACVQEEEIIKFVQWQMKEMWCKEKDGRVRSLLKNKDLLEMQKNLFSKDLKLFSQLIQAEMQEKLDQLSAIEQELRLEGNKEYREKMQEQLNLAYQDIDQYVENLSDMSAQMNISLVFLKEIVKDLKSIKTKIDSLSENVNQIADDVRKLRGKTYQELLLIRKKKVLRLAKLNEADSIYIPLKTIEYSSKTGDKINSIDGSYITQLLVEKFKNKVTPDSLNGEINEFLWGNNNLKHDVLLIRGQAGSGKSRSVRKIEEFLWNFSDQEPKWIPIYISLPQIKSPKFNLFEQAMDSEYYNFDQTQIREFKEAIRMKKVKVIFILDSYDEMKSDCLQQNLITTNNFYSDFEIEKASDSGKFVKFIITTRTEILPPTIYRNWFYGSCLENLKDIELIKFEQDQIDDYLQKYVELSCKRIIKSLYEFIKQLNQLDFDLQEFQEIWMLVEEIVRECNRLNKSAQMLFEYNEEERIIKNMQSHKVFKHLKEEQIITLQKDLQQLWNSQMFKQSINSVNIKELLITPFMVEIVVQVLPQMIKRGRNSNQFKEDFIYNLQMVIKQSEKSKNNIKQYQQTIKMLEDQKIMKGEKKEKYQQQAIDTSDILEKGKFFLKYSSIDDISVKDEEISVRKEQYKVGQLAELVNIALKLKKLTIYDFYDSFITFYHNQQIFKLSSLGKISNVEQFSIDVFKFSQSLSLDLTINQQISLSLRQKGRLKLNIYDNGQDQINAWEEQYLNDTDDNQEYLKLIRSCILLTSKGNSFQFTHKSIQEFLVAKYIYDELSKVQLSLDKNSIKNQEVLKKSQLNKLQFNISKNQYSGVMRLLLPQLSYQIDIDKKLIQIVKLSEKENGEFIPSASNSIYLLSNRKTFLGCMNFKNIKLKDTNLFALSFFGSDFSDSLFENVIIDSCNFNFCNFNNATWKDILCKELPYLKKHQKTVLVVSFSKDGNLLASGAADSFAIIWNLNTFEEVGRINHNTNDQDVEIKCVNFLQNDQYLVTAGDNQIIKISNISNLTEIKHIIDLDEHENAIIKIIISSDEKTMYSLDKQGLVIIWNVENIFDCKDVVFENEEMDLIGIVFTSSGDLFFAIDQKERCICYFEVISQNCLNKIQIFDYNFSKLTLSQNNCYLAALNKNGCVCIWNVSEKYQFKTMYFEADLGEIDDFSFSSDNQNIVFLKDDVLFIKNFHNFIDESVRYSNCQNLAISQTDNISALLLLGCKIIHHADLVTNQMLNSIDLSKEENKETSINERRMMFSNDSSIFIFQISQSVMFFWDLHLYQKKIEVGVFFDNILISKELNCIATYFDYTLMIVKTDFFFQQDRKYKIFKYVQRFASQEGNSLILIQQQNQLIQKDLDDTNNERNIAWFYENDIPCLAISQKYNFFLVGIQGKILVKSQQNDFFECFINIGCNVTCLATSHDDKILGAICDQYLILWEFKSQRKVFEHQCDSRKFIFSSCEDVLVFINEGQIYFYYYVIDSTILIDDIQEVIIDVAFSPYYLYFVSVGQNQNIFVKNLKTESMTKMKSNDGQSIKFVLFIDSDTFLTVNQINVKVWKIHVDMTVNLQLIKNISGIENIGYQQKNQRLLITYYQHLLVFDLMGFYNTDFFQLENSLFTVDVDCQIIGYPSAKAIIIKTLFGEQNQFQLQNQAEATALSFSNDSKLLANHGKDGQLKIWNLENKQIIKKVSFKNSIYEIVFDKNNEYLLSFGQNVQIWNIQNYDFIELSNQFQENKDFKKSSNNNDFLGLIHENICIINKQWKKSYNQRFFFDLSLINAKLFKNLLYSNRVQFSSKSYIAISDDQQVKIWNFTQLQHLYTFDNIYGYAFNQEEKLFLISKKNDLNFGCMLFNLENQQKQIIVNPGIDYPFIARFLSCDNLLLSSDNGVKHYRINANQLEIVGVVYNHHLIHNYQKFLICIKKNSTVRIVNLEYSKQINYLELPNNNHARFFSMVVDDDQNYLMLTSELNCYQWNLKTNTFSIILDLQKVRNIAFSQNNQFFFTIGKKIYSTTFGVIGKQLLGKIDNNLTSISFTKKKNEVLASGDSSYRIILWDIKGKQKIATFSGHSKPILTTSFSSNGQIIASGGEDNLIRLWNTNILQNSNILQTFDQIDCHSQTITCLKFSLDGLVLASAISNGQINLLSVQSKQYYGILKQHVSEVKILEFSEDQNFLLSCDDEITILWNIKNLNDIKPIFKTHLSDLQFALFNKNSEILFLNNNQFNLRNLNVNNAEIIIKNKAYQFSLLHTQQSITIATSSYYQLSFYKGSQQFTAKFNPEISQVQIKTFVFTSDGKKMATLLTNDKIQTIPNVDFFTIWNQENEFEWNKFRESNLFGKIQNEEFALQFINDDKYLSCIEYDKVQFYQYQDQNEVKIEKQLEKIESFFMNFERTIIALVQNENSQNSILIGSLNDLDDYNKFQKLNGFPNEIKSISFSFENKSIVIGDNHGKILLCDYFQGLQITQQLQADGSIHSIQFTRYSASILISCSLLNSNTDGNLFNFTKWDLIHKSSSNFNISLQTIDYARISCQGYYFAIITSKSHKLELFRLNSEKDDQLIQEEFYLNMREQVIDVQFDSTESYLSTATSNGSIQIYMFKHNVILCEFSLGKSINSINFSLNFESILVHCQNQNLFSIFLDHKSLEQVNNLFFDATITISQICLVNHQQALILTDKKKFLRVKMPKKIFLQKFQFERKSNIKPILLQNGQIFTIEYDKIKLYNVAEKTKLAEVNCSSSIGLFLSPDEKLFVSTKDGNFSFIQFKQLKDHSQAKQFKAHEKGIIEVKVTQNQSYLATYDYGKIIKLWDIEDKTNPQLKFTFSDASIKMQFSSDSVYFARKSDNYIIIIDIKQQQQYFRKLNNQPIQSKVLFAKCYETLKNNENLLIVTPKQVISVGTDNYQIEVKKQFQQEVSKVAISKDCQILSYTSEINEVLQKQIFVIKNFGIESKPLNAHEERVNSLSFSPDCKFLLSGGKDCSIKIWCMDELTLLAELNNLSGSVMKVSFSPDNFHFAAGTQEGSVGLYISNIKKKQFKKKHDELARCLGEDKQIGCLKVFSPQPLLQLQKCQSENMKRSEEMKALFEQKQ